MSAPAKNLTDAAGKRQYQVQVHIVEARDLKGKDANAMSDPICFVSIGDTKQNTCVQKVSGVVCLLT